MTPAQKSSALDMIAARAQTAEDRGLTATAKSWRDRYAVVEARPAAEIVGNTDFGSREGDQIRQEMEAAKKKAEPSEAVNHG